MLNTVQDIQNVGIHARAKEAFRRGIWIGVGIGTAVGGGLTVLVLKLII